MLLKCFAVIFLMLMILTKVIFSDTPCAARSFPLSSVVCVCNETYCDTITREKPKPNTYNAYTSNAAGLRFYKSFGQLKQSGNTSGFGISILTINPKIKYQTIYGFGGAVTDAAAINWNSLNNGLQKMLIDSYCSKTGIEYNYVRVPIGASDFSAHAYAYNEVPEDDVNLTHFNLTDEDYNLKIPMIKAIIQASPTPVRVLGSVWSPPLWMKTVKQWAGNSELKEEYYETYALYHLKFIESYESQGVPIWGITTTNEPLNGLTHSQLPNVGWTASNLGKWIAQNLGPTIRNSAYKNVKILASDDERITLPYYVNNMVSLNNESLQYIDGVSVHSYTDAYTPPSFIDIVSNSFPDKFIMSTEACLSVPPLIVQLGYWSPATTYITDIIQNINYNIVGWIDWNMCLNLYGGPNYVKNYADSPIIVYSEKREFYKQPMFYAMGHFSKFIPRGSQRINVEQSNILLFNDIENIAVITPDNTVVVILHNKDYQERLVKVKLNGQEVALKLSAFSVTSLEIPYED